MVTGIFLYVRGYLVSQIYNPEQKIFKKQGIGGTVFNIHVLLVNAWKVFTSPWNGGLEKRETL